MMVVINYCGGLFTLNVISGGVKLTNYLKVLCNFKNYDIFLTILCNFNMFDYIGLRKVRGLNYLCFGLEYSFSDINP